MIRRLQKRYYSTGDHSRIEALEYLGCPVCKSELKAGRIYTWKGDIRSGNLVCTKCDLSFPISVGRPVLMTADSINYWKTPIDKVLGIDDPVIPPLSIQRLVSLGIDEALSIAEAEKVREVFTPDLFQKIVLLAPSKGIRSILYDI